MVFFNYALRKLNAKIVYYGPGLCGKTTNLQWIHDHFEGGQRGKMISLATEGDRTIFFDLLPIDIGSIRGMDVTLQLYTVPGQVHYNSTRQLVLRGADGVVFVADSQRTMKASNAESFQNLQENLMLQGIDLREFPHILQFNKRDLRDLLSTEDLNESLNVFSTPIFEAIATEGIGVQESLEGIVKLVMRNLREKYEPVASASGPQALKPMKATARGAFQMPVPEPKSRPKDPLAPDFVSEPESPPKVDFGGISTPAVAASPVESRVRVEPPAAADTRDFSMDSGFAPFDSEDGISTAVYEPDDDQFAAAEAKLEGPDFGAGGPEYAPAEDSSAGELKIGDSDDFDGFFTDPRDEEGTSGDVSPLEAAVTGSAPDFRGGAATDSKVAVDRPEPVPSEESLDDLFETEVPTVKAFVDEVMEVVETRGARAGAWEPSPPSIDPSDMVVGPPTGDRFEDRIEAPGPFAPPPTRETAAQESDRTRAEEEEVDAVVRRALGASEDREALASLSAAGIEDSKETMRVAETPFEVQPVVPPPPEEPVPGDSAGELDQVTPVEFVDEGPEITDDREPEWEDQDNKATKVSELLGEPPSIEPVIEEPVFEEIVVEYSPVEEPSAAVPFAEAGIAEAPAGAAPVVAPPVGDDPLTKSQAFMLGSGEPFSDDEPAALVPEVLPREGPIVAPGNAIRVTAQDNQLHLQLKGSGAIAEVGEVRALDIEVPVPGQWVGNRKVTLQLRLTLTPAEDEDG